MAEHEGHALNPDHVENPLNEDLSAGDHFAGLPEGDRRTIAYKDLQAGRKAVIEEISDEIDSGDAHLMTRNELAEFIDWWINLGTDDNANAVIYDEMNNGNASVARHQKIAKEFFVHKGYER